MLMKFLIFYIYLNEKESMNVLHKIEKAFSNK